MRIRYASFVLGLLLISGPVLSPDAIAAQSGPGSEICCRCQNNFEMDQHRFESYTCTGDQGGGNLLSDPEPTICDTNPHQCTACDQVEAEGFS